MFTETLEMVVVFLQQLRPRWQAAVVVCESGMTSRLIVGSAFSSPCVGCCIIIRREARSEPALRRDRAMLSPTWHHAVHGGQGARRRKRAGWRVRCLNGAAVAWHSSPTYSSSMPAAWSVLVRLKSAMILRSGSRSQASAACAEGRE
jgi:hypothetical protein